MQPKKAKYSEEAGWFKSTVVWVGALGAIASGVQIYEGNMEGFTGLLISLPILIGGLIMPNAIFNIRGRK